MEEAVKVAVKIAVKNDRAQVSGYRLGLRVTMVVVYPFGREEIPILESVLKSFNLEMMMKNPQFLECIWTRVFLRYC